MKKAVVIAIIAVAFGFASDMPPPHPDGAGTALLGTKATTEPKPRLRARSLRS